MAAVKLLRPSSDPAQGTDALALWEGDELVFQPEKISGSPIAPSRGSYRGCTWLFQEDKGFLDRLEELTPNEQTCVYGMYLILTKVWEPGAGGCRWRDVVEGGRAQEPCATRECRYLSDAR